MSEPRGRAVVTVQQQTDSFVTTVLTDNRRDSLLSSLPAHVKPERFERNLVTAIAAHPKLLNCNPEAVFYEVAKAAALGLYLDPQLGEAYLITGWDAKAGREAPQLRLGYRGLIKLARQSGEIATVYAHEACANDRVEISLGTQKQLIHIPNMLEDERGEVVMYYAVVQYRDGTVDFEPMSLKAIYKVRDRSDGYRAWRDKKIKSTPWVTDEGEMAKKTVLRRLLKRLPQSPELGDALRIEDEDFRETVPVEPPSLRAKLIANRSPSRAGFSLAHVKAQTEASEAAEEPPIEAEVSDVPDEPETAASASESSPSGELPLDPLAIDIAAASRDERLAWIESLKAEIIKAKGAAMEVWKAHFEDRIKPLYETEREAYDALESWMGDRMKKLREGGK